MTRWAVVVDIERHLSATEVGLVLRSLADHKVERVPSVGLAHDVVGCISVSFGMTVEAAKSYEAISKAAELLTERTTVTRDDINGYHARRLSSG